MKILKKHKAFGGEVRFIEHESVATKSKMKFSVFLPDVDKAPESCMIWLSGLTCNEENFITKAGAQKHLAEKNMMVICPDTSPRGLDLPHEHESWDFGSGAGFYVTAQTEGYKNHYDMYTYINEEVYKLITDAFKVSADKISICGHSMGGHGALVIGLKNPKKYERISAFSPIVNPVNCPWGQKAFNGYLGENKEDWVSWDATELVKSGHQHSKEILIDQGLADDFLEKELLTDHFARACKDSEQKLNLRYHEGYDHSYYFISSFVKDHI